jgi:hypothetical protein
VFGLFRGPVAEGGMDPPAVIIAPEICEQIASRILAGRPSPLVGELDLQSNPLSIPRPSANGYGGPGPMSDLASCLAVWNIALYLAPMLLESRRYALAVRSRAARKKIK